MENITEKKSLLKPSVMSKVIKKNAVENTNVSDELAMWEAIILCKLQEKDYSLFCRFGTEVCSVFEKKEGSDYYQNEILLQINKKKLEEVPFTKENIIAAIKAKSVNISEYQNFMIGFDDTDLIEAYFNCPENDIIQENYLKVDNELGVFLPENNWLWEKMDEIRSIKTTNRNSKNKTNLIKEQVKVGLLKTPKLKDFVELIVQSIMKTNFKYVNSDNVYFMYEYFKNMHDYMSFFSETKRQNEKYKEMKKKEPFLVQFCENKIKENDIEIVVQLLEQYVLAYNDCYYFLTEHSRFFENLLESKNLTRDELNLLNNSINNNKTLLDFISVTTKLNNNEMFAENDLKIFTEKIIKFNMNKQMREVFANKHNSPDIDRDASINENGRIRIVKEDDEIKIITQINFTYLSDNEIANRVFKMIIEKEQMPESLEIYFLELENQKREEHIQNNFSKINKNNKVEVKKKI